MARYRPRVFASLWTSIPSRSINSKKEELGQYPAILTDQAWSIERFSFECRKVIGFAFTTLRDWLKKLAPLFHPMRSKTKTNRDSLVRVFPRFASATCNCFVFWLVHLITCVLCDWPEWLLWFWFDDTQLKTGLTQSAQLGLVTRSLHPIQRAWHYASKLSALHHYQEMFITNVASLVIKGRICEVRHSGSYKVECFNHTMIGPNWVLFHVLWAKLEPCSGNK